MIVVFFMCPKFILKMLKFIPNRRISIYFIKLTRTIHQTLNMKNLKYILLFSCFLWSSFFAVTAVFLFYIANFNLSIDELLVVFLVASVGMAIPLAPSGFGTYHASMILALSWYGISKDSALSAAIVLHLIQLSPSIVLYFILFLFTKEKNILGKMS